jgi:pimeloyl-ACP methyl ester carboxylesterase
MAIPVQEWKIRGKTFDFEGHPIFYMDEGAGPALVCLHGFPTASWDWSWIWPELVRRFRVIAPDMIGFGFSAKPQNFQYTLRAQATLHERLLNHLGIDAAHLLAHNYGDTVAQELLARFEERRTDQRPGLQIQTVCFLNGGIIPGEHRPRLIQRLLISPIGPLVSRLTNQRSFNRSFSEIFGPTTQPRPDELAQFWSLIECNGGRRVLHKLIRYMQERTQFKERWVGVLRCAPVPMRFINGPEDPVSGRHMAEAYRRLVPNPDVVYLDGIGHYPQVEAPTKTLQVFLDFFERHGDRIS